MGTHGYLLRHSLLGDDGNRYEVKIGFSIRRICLFYNTKMPRIFCEVEGIRTFKWTSHSPDLNIIETACRYISRKDNSNRRHYDSVDDLKEVVFKAWNVMLSEFIKSLKQRTNNSVYHRLLGEGNAKYH